ncbi:formate dehydrogenase accessory sulfurtransferase FdhD [Zhihengliuella salsuginis]|uniref:Sulfur carrier protein FdhD n=1 Tax=Zhihengliuella salsuginis TaxID=578222 RepID=A0ABQ3GMF3_9MICC|nr:formate dehydrogenase accessory sulfurtransferase FdhD [Zhihengliuella salsuginis]GHD10516.1 sulfurtransferase FdhD [Zhihengliuella salsuginis]
MGRKTTRRRIIRLSADGGERRREDTLAAEEPLEIRLGIPDVPGSGQTAFTVTMRTPGDDFDLVAGFLTGEGVIASADDLVSMRFCAGEDESGRQTFNVVEAQLAPTAHAPTPGQQRNVTTTSACGICGTASIDAVGKSARLPLAPAPEDGDDDAGRLPLDVLLALPDLLRERQEIFSRTGGVHAAGLFDYEGNLLCLREDVGRHNAVDKVVGWALRERLLPSHGTVLQVSGRASFELVQKTRMAGINILSAVSAPSSLAVELAESEQVTVAGFSRGSSVNVYTHPERIAIRRNDA